MDLVASNNLDAFMQVDREVELYGHILIRVKGMLADAFGSRPVVYHDGERRIITDVANEIYKKIDLEVNK